MAKGYKFVITHFLRHLAKYNYSAVAFLILVLYFASCLKVFCNYCMVWYSYDCITLVRTILCWMCALSLASDSRPVHT